MNVWRELNSGALDGTDGVMSRGGSWGGSLEVGLEENSEETISRGRLARKIPVSVTFCFLKSLCTLGSCGDDSWEG